MKQIPIFIINLKRDTEKKEHMQELCKKHSLKCQFVDAVYGCDLEQSYIDQTTDREKSTEKYGKELTRGEIGCALSHISIYKRMIEQNIENAIIFEDDIDLKEGFLSVVNSIDKFPHDWEIMLLGYYSRVSDELKTKASFRYKKSITGLFEAVRLVQLAFGTHGYMINKKGAKKLLRDLTEVVKPIDHYTGVDTYANMYAIRPRVVMLNENFKDQSSIAVERHKINEEKTNKKQLPIKIKILKRMGLLNIAMDVKMMFNRVRNIKEYE